MLGGIRGGGIFMFIENLQQYRGYDFVGIENQFILSVFRVMKWQVIDVNDKEFLVCIYDQLFVIVRFKDREMFGLFGVVWVFEQICLIEEYFIVFCFLLLLFSDVVMFLFKV